MSNHSNPSFRNAKEQRRYWILLSVFILLGIVASLGLIFYNNPVPVTSSSFIPVVRRRVYALIAMLIAAICQGLSTLSFQTVTNNKIITPSLLGFEALYTAIHTSVIFFFGTRAFVNVDSQSFYLAQVAIMVVMCLILYGWLLAGKYGDMHMMLLVGVILGTGLRSLSSFMQRLLTPSDFDILQARLFGSVNNADAAYYPISITLILIAGFLLLKRSTKMNVIALGRDTANTLGVNHKKESIIILVLIAVLMSVSTALIGPLTFYGFLVAALAYQLTPTYDHRYLFPMVLALAFLVITGAYFLMYHVFNAQGVVSVIIEMIGGITFLIMILRKGNL